jgi:CRISPR-associated protein Csx3
MNRFNAILVGGPPHSGKSVLVYHLTQHLRSQGIEHYVVRACPDGEGDWSNEAPPETVRLIRQKGRFTTDFVQQVAADLGRRHLPLLVDVGGRPQPEQEIIFAQCTHAILIAPDEDGLIIWRSIAARNGLHVIAEIISHLEGEPYIVSDENTFCVHLTGLVRHQRVGGPVFDALAARTATCLFEPPGALRQRHLDAAPTDLAVDLQALSQEIVPASGTHWLPEHLQALLNYLPEGVSSCLYGRGPNWIFAAAALHARPSPFFQFDVRLGWVSPPRVLLGGAWSPDSQAAELAFHVKLKPGYVLIEMAAPDYYVDFAECDRLSAPRVAHGSGVVLSGRVPHWLLAGVALAYADALWIAVYQPQLHNHAVVVSSHTADRPIGTLVALGQT